MPNVFLCVAWPLVIFLTIMAYRISKNKFKPIIAVTIAGMTGVFAIVVSANVIGVWYSLGHFEISNIFENLVFIVIPWLPQ